MARSENGETVIATQSLAQLFADQNDRVIFKAGSKNVGDTDGAVYYFAAPKEMLPNLADYRKHVDNNFDGSRHGFKGLSLEEKRAKVMQPETTGFEPTEPTAETPLQMAARMVLEEDFSSEVAGFTLNQRIADLAEYVERMINNPVATERYQPRIQAKLAEIWSWSTPRGRKGEGETVKSQGLAKIGAMLDGLNAG